MGADVGTTGKAAILLEAIREGRVKDRETAERVSGLEGTALPSALKRMASAGLITYEKLHARAIDWSTLQAAGSAPSTGRPTTKKTTRSKRPAPRRARKQPATPAPAGSGLEAARGATIDDESLERFRAWSRDLRARAAADEQLATEIDAMVSALEDLPRLGPEGALLFGMLEKIHAKDEG